MPSTITKSLTAHPFASTSSIGGNAWEAEQHIAEALYASFILPLWRDPAAVVADEQAPAWKGELESIQTGRAWQFQGLERLLPLLAAQLAGGLPVAHSTE